MSGSTNWQKRAQDRSRRAACDRCRNQKLRCERPHPSSACFRCTRFNAQCSTSPAQRIGRPRTSLSGATSPRQGGRKYSSESSQRTVRVPSGSQVDGDLLSTDSAGVGADAESLDSFQNEAYEPSKRFSDLSDLGNAQIPDYLSQQFDQYAMDITPTLTSPDMNLDTLDLSTFMTNSQSLTQNDSTTAMLPINQHIALDPMLNGKGSDDACLSRYRQSANDLMQVSSNQEINKQDYFSADLGDDIKELLKLSARFGSNVDAYSSAAGVKPELERLVLESGMSTSEQLLDLLRRVVSRMRAQSNRSNMAKTQDGHALLVHASGCYLMQARQWNIVLNLVLSRITTSPEQWKHIADVIPSTKMEGLSLDTKQLQVQFFLHACVHITQAVRKQVETLQPLVAKASEAAIDLNGASEKMRGLQAELNNALENID